MRAVGILNRSRCVIVVPVFDHIEPACEAGLREAERAGYMVWRRPGGAAIDVARNRLATLALEQGFEEIFWIDADIAFDVPAIEKLRAHEAPVVAAPYPKKAAAAFSFHFTGPRLILGDAGGVIEVDFAATGFLCTRREVYERMIALYRMPRCNEVFGDPFYPFFQPRIIEFGSGHWYLAEDFAFSYRTRECGYRILYDLSVRIWHIGTYAYSWEDGGGDRPRFEHFELAMNPLDLPELKIERLDRKDRDPERGGP